MELAIETGRRAVAEVVIEGATSARAHGAVMIELALGRNLKGDALALGLVLPVHLFGVHEVGLVHESDLGQQAGAEGHAATHDVVGFTVQLGNLADLDVLAQQLGLAQQRIEDAAAIAFQAPGLRAQDHRADDGLGRALQFGQQWREGIVLDVGVVVDDPEMLDRQIVQRPAHAVVVATGIAVVARTGEHGNLAKAVFGLPALQDVDGAVLGIVVHHHRVIDGRAVLEDALHTTDGFVGGLVVEHHDYVHWRVPILQNHQSGTASRSKAAKRGRVQERTLRNRCVR